MVRSLAQQRGRHPTDPRWPASRAFYPIWFVAAARLLCQHQSCRRRDDPGPQRVWPRARVMAGSRQGSRMGYGRPWVIKLGIMSGGLPGEDLSSSGISVPTVLVVGTMAAIEAGVGG